MTKCNGIKLTDRVLCRRRSTLFSSSCLLILSQIYRKVFSFLGMLRLFFTPFSLSQKRQRILLIFFPRVYRIKHEVLCNSRLKISFHPTCLMKIVHYFLTVIRLNPRLKVYIKAINPLLRANKYETTTELFVTSSCILKNSNQITCRLLGYVKIESCVD